MLTGISENLQDVSDSRKTAIINNELIRLNVDIATLQETRLADSGALKEKYYTFYWQGKGSGEHREYGVGFAVRNSLLSMIEPGSNGSERRLTLRINTTAGPVTLVSVYAPTMSAASDTKYEFCENLAAIISSVPNNEQLVLLGDFNARVGAYHDTWPSCRGQYGVGNMNENGLLLLSDEAQAQGVLEKTALKALAPIIIGSDPIQACRSQERSTHTLLPQCGLQHRPLLGVLHDQAATKEVS